MLPHPKLLEVMSRHHVFVFPSLAEGFGLVLPEALSSGLPLIATCNSAAPELVRDGVEGFIVAIRDPDAVAERLTLLYESEEQRYTMARAAKARAAEIKWTTFEDRIADLVRRLTP
jgi:glycosyltransferase involved in cell wall biosynthesis